jgi:hypothetical protein
MNSVVSFLMLGLAGCAGVSSGGDASGPAPDLTGVWAVTMRYSDGSCPDVTGGSQAAMWTVNRDAEGAYTISVQGDEKMPTLTGKEDAGAVVLVGLSESYPSFSTHWRIGGTATTVTGRALQTRVAKDAYKVKSKFGESTKDAVCSVVWTVEAKKQGT